MRKKTLFLLIVSGFSVLFAQTDFRFTNEPNPEELLPDFQNIHDVKKAETNHYIADTSGNFVKFSPNKTTLFVNNFPEYILYYMNPETKDTTESKSIFRYYKDTNTLESYKEFRLGETTHNFYNKKGKILKKENYFNGELESTLNWTYDENNQILKEERISFWKAEPKENIRTEYIYNAKNQLSEKNRYKSDVFLDKTLWFYDEEGNILREINYSVDNQYFTTQNIYDDDNKLIEKRQYSNDKLINTIDFKSTHESLFQNNLKRERAAQFYQEKTTKEYDQKGNWILSKFLNDEKFAESDIIDGNYRITERKITYK